MEEDESTPRHIDNHIRSYVNRLTHVPGENQKPSATSLLLASQCMTMGAGTIMSMYTASLTYRCEQPNQIVRLCAAVLHASSFI